MGGPGYGWVIGAGLGLAAAVTTMSGVDQGGITRNAAPPSTIAAPSTQPLPLPPVAPAAMQPGMLPDSPQPGDPPVVLSPAGRLPFPKSLDSQPGMRHRTGGPYRTAAEVRQTVATRLGCGTPGRHCDAILVKFFSRYEDATEAYDQNGAFASGLASDREVFLVTVKGRLDHLVRGGLSAASLVVDHWNLTVDATTGEVASGGTNGEQLRETD